MTSSLLDQYLGKKIPGYKPGSLSTDTVAFAAALDAVSRELPDVAASIVAELRDQRSKLKLIAVGSSRVDLQACKLEYSIVSPK